MKTYGTIESRIPSKNGKGKGGSRQGIGEGSRHINSVLGAIASEIRDEDIGQAQFDFGASEGNPPPTHCRFDRSIPAIVNTRQFA